MVQAIGAELAQHARASVSVLQALGPRPVIVADGTSIYGDHPGGEWVDETAPTFVATAAWASRYPTYREGLPAVLEETAAAQPA